MLYTLRRQFWILNARQAVKSFIYNCVVCRLHRGKVLKQQMASLFGERKGSRTCIKSYIALFVCKITSAFAQQLNCNFKQNCIFLIPTSFLFFYLPSYVMTKLVFRHKIVQTGCRFRSPFELIQSVFYFTRVLADWSVFFYPSLAGK